MSNHGEGWTDMKRRGSPLASLVRSDAARKEMSEAQPVKKTALVEYLKEKALRKTIELVEGEPPERDHLRALVAKILDAILAEEGKAISRADREKVVDESVAEIAGFATAVARS